jgi:small subunit ribosomal protein S18
MAKITSLRQQQEKPKGYYTIKDDRIIDYKNTDLLRRYVSSFGRIVSRKRSGLSAQQQRKMSRSIKRARLMGLLPFVHKD